MAFLVAGTLQVASQVADARESLGRKGKYSVKGPRVALALCSPEVSASTVALLEGVFQTLGFESCQRKTASVQGFCGELTRFRERLDAHGGPVGCAFMVLVAAPRQLRQSQQLLLEVSRCKALWGRPKVFLLLSSAPGEPGPSAQYDLSGARAALLLAVTQDRPGAQHDVEALGGLCQTLGFETTLRTDPTAQAFQEEMAQFRKRLDAHRGPVSCALVVLMAHGGPQGQLLGADGQEGHLEMLVQELSHCRALRGRPKIFLLQACRGGHRDAGVEPAAFPWFRRWLRAPPATPSQADVLHVCTDVQGSSSRGPTPGSPNQADVLMVYAAAEGCVAYRDEKGSDFIQMLVEVLRADPKADLLEQMTEVNRQVCELDVLGPDCDERRKACLEIRSSLRHRLCLQV
ncbi:hypothetical protein MJT46_017613 [Ovis ammon polii x Ovis aries]|nr:hypothetical protein MJT46_017613 [Ovis ammon polii x Ovis aries]